MSEQLTKDQLLTKPQLDALERLLRGPENWRGGSNAGGATGRMLKGLVTRGFLRGPPYYVTRQGRAALAVKNDIVARLKYPERVMDEVRQPRGS
jgi:hypothetical protein